MKKPVISFEISPPKADVSNEDVYKIISSFKELNPNFISVTYGAGGSQKGRTIEVVSRIKNELNIEAMSHLTSVGHSIEEIDNILNELKVNKIENIMALRGDAPKDQPDFDFSKNVFSHADQLIQHIKTKHDFCIGAAAYPEGYIDCTSIKDDIMHLKQKVSCGVDFLITQLFFDNRVFYNYVEQIRAVGINCPIMAGIMPVFKSEQIKRIVSLCGASMPAKLLILVEKYQGNPDDMKKAGIEYASNQMRGIIENGLDGIQLYTMNKLVEAKEILQNVGVL